MNRAALAASSLQSYQLQLVLPVNLAQQAGMKATHCERSCSISSPILADLRSSFICSHSCSLWPTFTTPISLTCSSFSCSRLRPLSTPCSSNSTYSIWPAAIIAYVKYHMYIPGTASCLFVPASPPLLAFPSPTLVDYDPRVPHLNWRNG